LATPIYHFTHRDNFASILASDGMLCDRICQNSGLTARDIAYSSLKAKRMRTAVEVPPYRTLGDYVPFYFGVKSPMLFTYKNGRVIGSPENQDELIYLAATAEAIAGAGIAFAFTDGHPVREPKAFFNDLACLCKVDLPLMTQRDWYDCDEDPDRMRRRQAEFLVYQRFTWEHVQAIGVRTEAMATWVGEAIRDMPYKPPCLIRPSWYYPG
jgi:hypothetical protein